ncbi:phosphohydrolase [Desulfosarcina widdelii]|uniref:Phosphohydrolase n=1 Tax=Desulfosarcina widdelii TaxID=947919 RepID=A0A5K7Z5U8_9BACT|nr:HDOD domain-containing protein [Desulfosarcina widdelii]BBO76085.1 phosphohydrolase [Desulfosarcina widdelii]
MPFYSIDQLKPGMVLATDVTDMSGRLLLSKGQAIDPKHLNIFKMWGVPEVQVQDDQENGPEDSPTVDPEVMRHTAESLKSVFSGNDLNHPAVAEIFRQAVFHRSRSGVSPTVERSTVAASESTPSSNSLEMRQKIRNRDIKLPEVPTIIFKLNDTIADPFSSSDDIAQVISKSPGLAAQLLRIVNSAFYGFPSRIDSISRAVTVIGSKEISALAAGIATMEIFKDIPKNVFDTQAFTHHSLTCGVLARILAAGGNIRNTEQLFVSGLLHDIGRMVMFRYFPRQVGTMLAAATDGETCLYDVEKRVMGFRHTDIAADLFEKWKFPVALSQNVVFHHRPTSAQDPARAAVIHLADIIAHALGEGKSGEWCIPTLDTAAWDKLRISPQTLATIIPQAIHHLNFLTSIFTGES